MIERGFDVDTKTIIAIGALGAAFSLSSAANAVAISGLYNTGVDDSNVVLTSGTDSHYRLNGTGTPSLYNNGAYIQASDATYIGANSAGGYSVNPNVYTLTFSLVGLDATTASLSGQFAADNHGDVRLNGSLIGHTDSFTSFTSFSANSGFLAGDNVLSFTVTDDGPPSALVVSMLRGTANAAGTTAMVPEPASWALMIVGFGAIGTAMRRRKVAVSFA